ncbi:MULTISPECIES: hypothetical protein [unclassified Bacillus (in: firmicutes)]|uniref:hypothetical protein n=1 Tax=unclassified Bacillus (in: firmicutes) TaxID=185979 RepID=UPI001BE87DDC|nr:MULTISPECIES: hypothetical protein [unclassified Bacillus (in: firmicutes)]MBT2636946.1 hypothetical protein [Bacillus sp. ISL-39]MBT2660033.1 hypothetical protein [Bacillus sp. ISL-45]
MGYNRNENDVAGLFFPHRDRDKVRATVDFDDLCRAVRRCIIEDLVAGARDDRDDDRDRRHKKCCRY